MHTLQHLFGKSLTERPWDGGYRALITRPLEAYVGSGGAHEAARQTLLATLARAFRLRIVWDELASLGTDVNRWLTPGAGVHEIKPGFDVASLLRHLEPGGWLIHGSVAPGPGVGLVRMVSAMDAVAAGADVAVTALLDSDAWEICVATAAVAGLDKALALASTPSPP
jgi:hypothetical protein